MATQKHTSRLSRREMLKLASAGIGATMLAACGSTPTPTPAPTPTPVVVTKVQTQIVEKVVEKPVEKVVEKVVTATPVPPTATKAVPTVVAAPVTVTYWHDVPTYQETFLKIIDMFQKENPTIKVKSEIIPDVGWTQALLASFVAGTEPDLSWIQFDFALDLLLKYKPWLDVTDLVKGWPEVDVMPKPALDNMTLDNRLYALIASNHWQGLFVRKTWLDKIKWAKPHPYMEDWNDMLAMAKQFTFEDPDGNGKADTWGYEMFGSLSRNYATLQFEYMMNAAGEELVKAGKMNFNTDTGRAVLQYMQDLVFKEKVCPPDTATYTHVEFYRDVQAGRVGMGRMADWNVNSWNDWLKNDYVVTPFPPMKKGGTALQSSVFRAWVTSKNTKKVKEALKFAQFYLGKPAQEVMYAGTKYIMRPDLDWKKLGADDHDLFFRTTKVNQIYLVKDMRWTADTKAALCRHLQMALIDTKNKPADVLAAAEKEIGVTFK